MRQTVFFLIFFFAGFSCAQGLNHYIKVIKSGDTSEGRLYNVYVYVKNQSVDAVPANRVTISFPIHDGARLRKTATWPEGIIGYTGQIPLVVQEGTLVSINHSDTFTVTNSSNLDKNWKRYGLQYLVEASYIDSFSNEVVEGITVTIASDKEFLAREEARELQEAINKKLAEEAQQTDGASRRYISRVGSLNDLSERNFFLTLGLACLIIIVIVSWVTILMKKKLKRSVKESYLSRVNRD
tara:strand:+ start:286 stop:1005 length:720 start_codon:yes stop_codon:yes gene_type:complete